MNTAIYNIEGKYITVWNSKNTSVNYYCDSVAMARAICRAKGKREFNKYLQYGSFAEIVNQDSLIQDTANQW